MAMIVRDLFGESGAMPDIAWTGDGWIVAFRELKGPLWIQWLTPDGTIIDGATTAISTGSLDDSTFPVVHAVGGRVWLAYRAFRGGAWVAVLREIVGGQLLRPERILGVAAGNRPVALSDGWLAWQGLTVVQGLNLSTGEVVTLRSETRGTGLAGLEGAWPVFVDEARLSVPGMLNPVTSGAYTVGEGQNGLIASIGGATGQVQPGIWNTPRCAEGPGVCAAVGWGPGVRLVLFTAADLQPATEPMVSIDRPMWLGFFAFGPDRTTVSLPGNCRVLIPEGLVVSSGRTVALYVASEGAGSADLDNLDKAIGAAHAAHPGIPVLAYWTRGAQQQRIPAGCDLTGVESYRLLGEPLVAFEARVRAAVQRVPAAVLIAQCYTSNAGNDPDLAALVPVYARIARNCPNVVGILGFSGVGRATGLQDHPEVRPLWQQLANSIPGPPTVRPVEEMPVNPKITITHYDSTLFKGRAWSVDARIGDTDVTVRIGGDGNLTIHAKNPAGEDQTGQRRTVQVQA